MARSAAAIASALAAAAPAPAAWPLAMPSPPPASAAATSCNIFSRCWAHADASAGGGCKFLHRQAGANYFWGMRL